MMMRKIVIAGMFIAAMAILGCKNTEAQQIEEEEYEELLEQARWGDGQAYIKLADCYRDGKGVEKDLAGMYGMINQFKFYGDAEWEDEYLDSMPIESDLVQINIALMRYKANPSEETKAEIDNMAVNGLPDVYTLQGFSTINEGDTLEGVRLIEKAASLGSNFAELSLCFHQWEENTIPDVERLKALATKTPFAYQLLGNIYSEVGDDGLEDESLAASYYLKADEKAFLSRDEARWLLDYHKNGGNLQLSEKDMKRLQVLADSDNMDSNYEE